MANIKGKEAPRIFTPPLRELTPETSLGYAIDKFARELLHINLHPWQKWLLIHAFEIVGSFDSEWHFRFRTILVLVGRQNGKTTLGAVVALFFLYALRVGLVIGTAQDLEQSEDTWALCVELAKSDPELAEQIQHVWFTNGAKRLQLKGGRDYRVRASSRKAGRGKSADLVLLDELREHQNFQAYGALSKTGIAREDAVLFCMSNAGDATSVVLRHLRQTAHRALGDPDGICTEGNAVAVDDDLLEDDDTLGIFEWSAEPDAKKTDREAWAQANPSLGYTITERALRSACAQDPNEVFLTECLCQWVTATIAPPFPVGAWEKGIDAQSEIAPDSPLWFGVDVSADRTRASIAVCGLRADRSYHVELIAYKTGLGWLQTWFAERVHKYRGMKVALQSRGAPVASMAEIIGAVEGVTVVECAGANVAGWCGRFYDAVASLDDETSETTPVYHIPQGALDLAANIASTRPLGDGAWAWDRNKSAEDISPLVAVTMAFGAATSVEDVPFTSAYEEYDLLLV